MARVVTLDAGVLIALMDSNDSHHGWAVGIMKQTLSDDLNIPALTFAECLVYPARKNLEKKFLANIEKLGLKVIDLAAREATELADLRAKSKLRMPDAVVLQVALKTGKTVATTDKELAAKAADFGVTAYHPRFT